MVHYLSVDLAEEREEASVGMRFFSKEENDRLSRNSNCLNLLLVIVPLVSSKRSFVYFIHILSVSSSYVNL